LPPRESGDEAAEAWDQVRQLGDTIDALEAELRTTQAALHRAEKELAREQVRSGAAGAHPLGVGRPLPRPARSPLSVVHATTLTP
jgi:hypothetical protein